MQRFFMLAFWRHPRLVTLPFRRDGSDNAPVAPFLRKESRHGIYQYCHCERAS